MKKRMVTKSSAELADVLGLDFVDAVEWETRHSLTNKIIETVRKKQMTVTTVAKKAKTSRARVTNILKGDSQGISIDVLLRVLGAVGQTVKLSFRKVS